MTCPDCQGKGRLEGEALLCGPSGCKQAAWLRCWRCAGSGWVPEEMAGWIQRGAELRRERLERGLSLHEEAGRRGLKASELSDAELGKRDPDRLGLPLTI